MGTRSGEIDAGVLTFISQKERMSASKLSDLLNKKKWRAGRIRVSSDMREIEAAVKSGEPAGHPGYGYVRLPYPQVHWLVCSRLGCRPPDLYRKQETEWKRAAVCKDMRNLWHRI